MMKRIEEFVYPSEDTSKDDKTSYLLLQLLKSVFLQGGQLPVLKPASGSKDKDPMEDAAKHGVLVYDPTGAGSVLQEPVTAEAVRRVGRKRVLGESAMTDVWLEDKKRAICD